MKTLNNIFLAVLIVGAINWGSIGLFGINIVGKLFGGNTSMISRIIFSLVGISGLWGLTFFTKIDNEENSYKKEVNS